MSTSVKTILITGASSGIGAACAEHFADLGWHVTATGRSAERLQPLVDRHANIEPLAFDVSDEQSAKQELAGRRFDAVLLNAGTCEYVDLDRFEPDMFRRVFEVNFFGLVNCVNALLPSLQAGDQVLVVDSLARLLPFTRSEAYGASKAAAYYFTKSLDVDMRKRGVVVKSVSPGFVETPLTDKNTFAMPMRITAKQAAQSVAAIVQGKKRTTYFPTVFAGIIRFLGLLPAGLQAGLCLRLIPEGKSKRKKPVSAATHKEPQA